jgi:TRAP-type transport system periplasmic protein
MNYVFRAAFAASGTAMFSLLSLLSANALAQPQVIRVAYAVAENSHYGAGVNAFGAELSRLTNGKYRVEHLPAGKAGGELEIMNKVKAGELEMGSSSTGPLGNFVPESKVFDLPFLFYDYNHARRTMDGPIGQRILELFPKYGMRGLAWTENGFRHITNNKRPITMPDDLAALKLRTMENSVHMATLRAMKAEPTPMAFPKLFKALQDGELDGQENPLPVILASKFSQTQKYLSLTQHFYSAGIFVISPKLWDGLPPADRTAFIAAAKVGAKAQRDRVNADEFAALTQLREQGMKVNSYVDTQAFRKLLRPQYATLLPTVDLSIVDDIRKQR